jgi:AhpC/TSA family
MTLKEQLDDLKAKAAARIPPETQEVMRRAIDDTRTSGLLAKTLKVGDRAPEFTLPDEDGRPVSLTSLLATGPVVLSFYRGRW